LTIPDWLARLALWLVLLYRRIRYGYAFRRIPLTQGKYAIVDVGDFEGLSKYKWHVVYGRYTFYAERVIRVGVEKQRVAIKMHREIIDVCAGKFVDHINHNGLDNRRANLRPATRTENNRNRRKGKKRTFGSKYKGVTWYKNGKLWAVRIRVICKSKFMGSFKNEIEAAKVYDGAAKKYHGEFASLNFEPEEK